jgi:hypothetical protein
MEDNSLENQGLETLEDNYSSLDVHSPNVNPANTGSPDPKSKKHRFTRRQIIRALVALALLIALIIGLSFLVNRLNKPEQTIVINTQSLDNGTLNELTGDDPVKQQLTITPDTIFKNSVTVQGSAQVDKDVNIDGSLTVGGRTILQDSTDIDGDLNVRQTLTVGQNASLGGNLSVNGQITALSLSVGSLSISSINLSNDLTFGGHIIPSGTNTPSSRISSAAAGGTVSVSGNDTSGTVTINTGGGALIAGEMAIITFAKAYGTTPKVQLTPITSTASNLRYYATRSATFFTIDTSSAPANGTTYVFDYFVTQ